MSRTDEVLSSISWPVKIQFEPTINCNLSCPMCDRTHKDDYYEHRDRQLPYETVKRFLHEAGKHRTRYFLLIGGGEPLADPHIIEYIQILKSYGVYVHLWTNGTLITEENAPFFANSCNMITVSLDSTDPTINDSARGMKGATEKSIAGLRLLRKNNNALFLRIHSVISALNIDDLRQFADLAGEIGITEIGGALIAPFGFVQEKMRFSKKQIGMISSRIEDICEYAKTKGIALGGCYANTSAKIIQNLTHIHSMYEEPAAERPDRHITCMGLWGQAVVRPNGDVSICCFLYHPVLGNLHDQTFQEIWNSEKANRLRELVKSGEYIGSPCVGCDTGHPIFTEELKQNGTLAGYLDMVINAR